LARRQRFRNNGQEGSIVILRAGKNNRAVKLLLQRIGNCLQQFPVSIRNLGDTNLLTDFGQRQLVPNLRSAAARVRFGFLRMFLFPLANIDI